MKKILLAILIVASVLRFVGIYPGYNQFHPDEQMSYSTAASMLQEKKFFPTSGYSVKLAYPYLVPLINYFFFKQVFVPLSWTNYFITNSGKILEGFIHLPLAPADEKRIFQFDILGYREVNTIFWARTVTAFFGVGVVFLTYLLGSKIANKKVGLIAAFLIAFDFRQITNSHIALPDIYNSFFLLLSLISFVKLLNSPTKASYFLAGLAAALAFNIKFQFFALAGLIVTHILVSIREKGNIIKSIFDIKFILSLLLTPLLLMVINPFHFIYIEESFPHISYVAMKYGMGTNMLNLFPVWYLFNVALGPPLFIVSVVGIALGLIKYFKYSLIILSALVLQGFLFFYYSTGGFHVRNLIPMTPLLLIFAALVLDKIRNKLPIFLFIPILIAIVFVPARNSLISDYNYTRPWNFNLLSEWLFKNPLDGPIASNATDPPTGTPELTRSEFHQSTFFSMAEHIENDAKYALMNTDWIGNGFYYWMVNHPGTLSEKWNKPTKKLRDTYFGLSIEEMLRFQIFAATKPWQSPEANLILVEFPDWSKVEMVKVFHKSGEVASQENIGSTFVNKIPIKAGHLYRVIAGLESSLPLKSNTRDGFLRVNMGSINCVSARVFDGGSKRKTIYCLAPTDSEEMIISLQVENFGNIISVSNLEINESVDIVKNIKSTYPYIDNRVELELIYQNSQANL